MRQQIPVRLHQEMLDALNRRTRDRGESRNEFIVEAIREKLASEPVYAKGFEAAKKYMLESSLHEMRRYHDALLLVRDGMAIPDALQKVFKARYDTLTAIDRESERFRSEVSRDER